MTLKFKPDLMKPFSTSNDHSIRQLVDERTELMKVLVENFEERVNATVDLLAKSSDVRALVERLGHGEKNDPTAESDSSDRIVVGLSSFESSVSKGVSSFENSVSNSISSFENHVSDTLSSFENHVSDTLSSYERNVVAKLEEFQKNIRIGGSALIILALITPFLEDIVSKWKSPRSNVQL